MNTALEVVEHIDPGGHLAIERGNSHPIFAVQTGGSALPLIKGVLITGSYVVERDEHLSARFLSQRR